MRYVRIAVAILLCGVIGGCAGAPTTPAPSSPAAAVDVTGTWRGSFRSQGVVPVGDVTLTLQQTGNKLTGSSSSGGPLEGVVQGNTVTYTLTSGRGGGELTVNGDEMTGYSRAGSRLDLKRVK
jgi:hypothetical protein